ncbi:hypothetical protein CCHR01_13713 [Colletotrichum chrysophilum]|uniref:Uncharacterized protein n=1 Tax=Colletotrichum chrysophilum TaxID=1836956 RepID=A0AAD9EG85_9PEZI|nr:hypothetical protein CCHR01_13713 [Colletotrichum chrysophilum]
MLWIVRRIDTLLHEVGLSRSMHPEPAVAVNVYLLSAASRGLLLSHVEDDRGLWLDSLDDGLDLNLCVLVLADDHVDSSSGVAESGRGLAESAFALHFRGNLVGLGTTVLVRLAGLGELRDFPPPCRRQ